MADLSSRRPLPRSFSEIHCFDRLLDHTVALAPAIHLEAEEEAANGVRGAGAAVWKLAGYHR